MDEVAYDLSITIDKNNVIEAISDGWSRVAKNAGALTLLPKENFIGRSIESFLGSDVTQMYYSALFKLVRLRQRVTEREYRCDSFTHQRTMLMRLIPKENGSIEMQHFTLRESPFKHEVIIKNAPSKEQQTLEYVKRCSICNKLHYPHQTQWMTPEDLSQEHRVDVRVIYTVCPECKNKNWFPSKSTS